MIEETESILGLSLYTIGRAVREPEVEGELYASIVTGKLSLSCNQIIMVEVLIFILSHAWEVVVVVSLAFVSASALALLADILGII